MSRIAVEYPDAYARQSEQERRQALRCMSVKDSIAIGGALLTSDLMRLAEFLDDDEPLSLAIALRLGSKPVERLPGQWHVGNRFRADERLVSCVPRLLGPNRRRPERLLLSLSGLFWASAQPFSESGRLVACVDALCQARLRGCRSCRDRPPEPVIGGKHAVIPMPVPPRRRDKIREPVEELER
jgi:hypothetical protein